MSYSVTGIQAGSAGFTLPSAEPTSGGVIHSPLTKTTVDHASTKVSVADTTKAGTPNKFQTASTAASHPVSGSAAPVDTVTLSTVDKVRNLRQDGEGDSQIATTLNLPIKEVDSDLHVSTQAVHHQSFTVAPVVSPLSDGTATHTVSATA